jgi:hypothetical protein
MTPTDLAIPLAERGRMLHIPPRYAYDLSEAWPREYRAMVDQRLTATIFQPVWGSLFDEGEDESWPNSR